MWAAAWAGEDSSLGQRGLLLLVVVVWLLRWRLLGLHKGRQRPPPCTLLAFAWAVRPGRTDGTGAVYAGDDGGVRTLARCFPGQRCEDEGLLLCAELRVVLVRRAWRAAGPCSALCLDRAPATEIHSTMDC